VVIRAVVVTSDGRLRWRCRIKKSPLPWGEERTREKGGSSGSSAGTYAGENGAHDGGVILLSGKRWLEALLGLLAPKPLQVLKVVLLTLRKRGRSDESKVIDSDAGF